MKLKNLKQAHGKIEDSDEDIMEDSFSKKQRKFDLLQYKQKLNSLSLEELKALSSENGLIPIDNKDDLIKSLVKFFKKQS
jgi:hypothetical protein